MKYFFEIAEVVFRFDMVRLCEITEGFTEFYRPNQERADIVIKFETGVEPEEKGRCVFKNDVYEIYEFKGKHYRKSALLSEPFCGWMTEEGSPDYSCRVYVPGVDKKWKTSELFSLIGFENVLYRQQALILHASFIEWRNRGILFTAPSGTGKSTQADLWEAEEGAEIINGDKTILRRAEEGWKAYGSPYAGSSKVYRNKGSVVGAIVVLRQGKENILKRLPPGNAFRYLYSETIVNTWNRDFVIKVTEWVAHIASEIPVYYLECLPEKSAVQRLKRELEQVKIC